MSTPEELAAAFPDIDPGGKPFGDRVLVQLRNAKRMSDGGILLPHETRDQEKWMTTVAKVIAVGPLAFKDRDTLKPWPEGTWAEIGDYVRCPKWGGDRWEFPVDENDPDSDLARFAIFRDRELICGITCDPLKFKDYV